MYYIGVDLGGTNIAVGIVSVYGKLLYKKNVKTEADKGYMTVINNIINCIEKTLEEYSVDINNVAAIGIGSPGVIDSEIGEVIFANNFKGMKNILLADEIQKRINKKVYISNDANCAALGEAVEGAAKGYRNVIMITLGTGVGGGLIINGKLYEGGKSRGAELGHIVVNHDGERCSCGRRGCWEAYASANALIRQTKKAIDDNPDSILAKLSENGENISGKTAFLAEKEGCPVAKKVIETYIKYISEGLIDMTNIFRPEIIIIGGGISNEGDSLLVPIRNYVKQYSYGSGYIDPPKIERAMLGNDAGIIGSAMLAKFTPSGVLI